MNSETNYAALFYSENPNELDVLERNVRDYPVSSVARFMLLYHYKKNNLPGFESLANQTGIYLNNPLWIQFQLSQIEKSDQSKTEEIFPEELLKEPEIEDVERKEESELPATVNEQITEIPSSEIKLVNEENKEDSISQITEESELPTIVNEQITEIPSSEISIPDEDSSKEKNEEFLTEDEKNIQLENEIDENSFSDIKIPEQENIPSEKILKPGFNSDENESVITFEPLHTVDYFASQGIKINEEALANDHLGKQVKSFTAWLKSMKKLHPGQMPEQNEVIEKIIQTSSETSNKDANVLTEAMAEVLTKQGKREKAIEMYEKLSLINPSKNAYFAAKIESLKII